METERKVYGLYTEEESSVIENAASSCETSCVDGDPNEYHSCLSTTIAEPSTLPENDAEKTEVLETCEEMDPFATLGSPSLQSIICFCLFLVVLVYLIFQSPLFSMEECQGEWKRCSVSFLKVSTAAVC
ncbi:hypothetical protein WA556_004185 [Blastocystis sp. ATCC 50177/Nand II]